MTPVTLQSQEKIAGPPPGKSFLIAVDSDGCVFDNMERKHKECFCPAFIDHYELQPVAHLARETWEFVNLHCSSRGLNRFQAVVRTLDLLAMRAPGGPVPEARGLREWVGRENRLANPVLEAELARTGDPDLARALAWSREVNAAVERIASHLPPFPHVRKCLAAMVEAADVLVVSQASCETLFNEWRQYDIERYASHIGGQEMGTKTEQLARAAGTHAKQRVLMIGDSPGDLAAARRNGILFHPILPGREAESWQRIHQESLARFVAGTYAGDYERALIAEFEAILPEDPPWQILNLP